MTVSGPPSGGATFAFELRKEFVLEEQWPQLALLRGELFLNDKKIQLFVSKPVSEVEKRLHGRKNRTLGSLILWAYLCLDYSLLIDQAATEMWLRKSYENLRNTYFLKSDHSFLNSRDSETIWTSEHWDFECSSLISSSSLTIATSDWSPITPSTGMQTRRLDAVVGPKLNEILEALYGIAEPERKQVRLPWRKNLSVGYPYYPKFMCVSLWTRPASQDKVQMEKRIQKLERLYGTSTPLPKLLRGRRNLFLNKWPSNHLKANGDQMCIGDVKERWCASELVHNAIPNKAILAQAAAKGFLWRRRIMDTRVGNPAALIQQVCRSRRQIMGWRRYRGKVVIIQSDRIAELPAHWWAPLKFLIKGWGREKRFGMPRTVLEDSKRVHLVELTASYMEESDTNEAAPKKRPQPSVKEKFTEPLFPDAIEHKSKKTGEWKKGRQASDYKGQQVSEEVRERAENTLESKIPTNHFEIIIERTLETPLLIEGWIHSNPPEVEGFSAAEDGEGVTALANPNQPPPNIYFANARERVFDPRLLFSGSDALEISEFHALAPSDSEEFAPLDSVFAPNWANDASDSSSSFLIWELVSPTLTISNDWIDYANDILV
jgi:hypothetical protein